MIWTNQEIIDYISKWKSTDIYECVRKQTKSIRSLAQNKYYWAVVISIISKWSWDSTLSTHYGIKSMFDLKTTTDLEVDEFKFMIEAIRELFNEKYNIRIPLPSDLKDEESLYASLEF